jgi:hypothetical protein
MRRFIVSAALAAALAGLFLSDAGALHHGSESSEPPCEGMPSLCPDPATGTNYEGEYVGHDEPALLFYSSRPGSGNSADWRIRLPVDATTLPSQDGTGGTWNFQQRLLFWFGMALCDSESYPNPGKSCTPNSDENIKDGTDPTKPDYIGNHAGTGFLELQFIPPGWVPDLSCDARKWCVVMKVFGLSDSQTQTNSDACLFRVGEEWQNFAFLTRTGIPQAPPDPLNATSETYTPDPARALFMNGGDELTVSIHDSSEGLVTEVRDLTSGERGFMTASIRNGFAHPIFKPQGNKCTEEAYAFHPMYSTSSEHTRVPWTAHSYNISFSDEIGHFEYCSHTDGFACSDPAAGDPEFDRDDLFCYNADESLLVQIGGCTGSDIDFDGVSYQPVWPGTLRDPQRDRQLHGQSLLFTSPRTNGRDYERMAFEANLPAIEFLTCPSTGGPGCTNPPPGAAFYPIYSTQTKAKDCAWQEGGTLIPGTTNTFGGTSTSEYGPELSLFYPAFSSQPAGTDVNNYRNVLGRNPCPSSGLLPR